MAKKQKPTPKPRKLKAAGVIPPVSATAERKISPEPCKTCFGIGMVTKCHACRTVVEKLYHGAQLQVPSRFLHHHFKIRSEPLPHNQQGFYSKVYVPYVEFMILGEIHVYCLYCLDKHGSKPC